MRVLCLPTSIAGESILVKKQLSSTREVIREAYKEVAVKEVRSLMHISEEVIGTM